MVVGLPKEPQLRATPGLGYKEPGGSFGWGGAGQLKEATTSPVSAEPWPGVMTTC